MTTAQLTKITLHKLQQIKNNARVLATTRETEL